MSSTQHTLETRAEVVRRIEAGESIASVARALNVTRGTARRWKHAASALSAPEGARAGRASRRTSGAVESVAEAPSSAGIVSLLLPGGELVEGSAADVAAVLVALERNRNIRT